MARRIAGLSQEQLAEAVGVHRPAVSAWERGVHKPTPRNLEDIAAALGLSVDALRSMGSNGKRGTSAVREATNAYNARVTPRVPPRAYELIYGYCKQLEEAEVPEDAIEEARRLMSGTTFNTLRAHMVDDRDEDGWIKDVKAAWAFIKQELQRQGFDL